MHATLSLKALYAANAAASTEETRYYLCGVHVEISARQVIYVATDGHVLFAHRESGEPDNSLIGTWIIPSATIKAAKGKKHGSDYAILEGEPGKLELTLKLPDGPDLEFTAIDGTFPDWRRVVPLKTKQDGPVLRFDPDRLKGLWRAGKLLGKECVGIAYNGENPALLDYATDNTFGLIMPMRNSVASMVRPGWVSEESATLPVSTAGGRREADALAAE